MSEENNEGTTPDPPNSPRLRNKDGSFMSQEKIDKMNEEVAQLRKQAKDYLVERNKALMQGTNFTEKYFKGMNSKQINQFLNNFHAQKKKDKPEPEAEPNTPILGTPVGSSKQKTFIDKYLSMKLVNNRPEVNFDCPASIVFEKHKNKEEARLKWLDRQ